MAKLTKIAGISPEQAETLRAAGIRTTGALIKNGGTAEGRREIARATGISEKQIERWVFNIDLFRVRGIGPEYAELLEISGIRSVDQLAEQEVEYIYRSLAQLNREVRRVGKLPTRYQVQEWIKQARRLPSMITN